MLDQSLHTLKSPSAMVIAYHNDQELFSSYRGTARLNQHVPVTGKSGFMIASNSKVFTSVMMFMLRDSGALPQGLDTKVADLMPDWIEPMPPRGQGRQRTPPHP